MKSCMRTLERHVSKQSYHSIIITLIYFTGIIDSEMDSLFTYNSVNMWSDFYSPDFQPIFLTEDFDSAVANELCGDDSFCQFDIIVTGRTDIALTTLQGSKRVDLVANLSLPGMSNDNGYI